MIGDVQLSPDGDAYKVFVTVGELFKEREQWPIYQVRGNGGKVRAGRAERTVQLQTATLDGVSEGAAKRLRDFKGKKVRVSFIVFRRKSPPRSGSKDSWSATAPSFRLMHGSCISFHRG